MARERRGVAEVPPQRDGRLRPAGSRGPAAPPAKPTPRRAGSGGSTSRSMRDGGEGRVATGRPARNGARGRAVSTRPSRPDGRRPAPARPARASHPVRTSPPARAAAPGAGRRRPSRRIMALAAAVVLAAGILLACAFLAPGDSAPTAHSASVAWTGEAPGIPATPRKLWARGSLPYLYQTDAAWASHAYGNDDVATSGCGPTCISMVYIALTGDTSMDPAAMADYSTAGGYVEQGMTAWRLMTDGAAGLGLYSRELWIDRDMVASALEGGAYVVVNVEPGDFTTVGHYMVIEGLDEDGLAILHDPNSAYNSLKRWPLGQILSQTSNLWALST